MPQQHGAADLSTGDRKSRRKQCVRIDSHAAGVTSSGAMRPYGKILWPVVVEESTTLTSIQLQTLHSSPLTVFTSWRTRDSYIDRNFTAAAHTRCLRFLYNSIAKQPLQAKKQAQDRRYVHRDQLFAHTHTHTFNGPLSGTTQVSRYQKGKTSLDFTEARDSEWHQLGHMQVCTSLQTDNHASTPPFSFLQTGCPSCHPTNSVKALKLQPGTKVLHFTQ